MKSWADGYIDATELCKAGNKEFAIYNRNENKGTKNFLDLLSKDIGVPRSELIKTSKRGDLHTWVHPRVAVHLAQWVSSSFAVQVTKDIN